MNARHKYVRLACKAPTSDQAHQFQNIWTKGDVIIYIRKEELRILYLRSALGPASQFCLEANGVSSNKVDSSDMIVEKEVKVPAAAHEGEASFASDCIERQPETMKLALHSWIVGSHLSLKQAVYLVQLVVGYASLPKGDLAYRFTI
jgi:hypothetical protein